MKKLLTTLLSLVILLSSCTDDSFLENAPLSVKPCGDIKVRFEPFVSGSDVATRTTVNCNSDGTFSLSNWEPEFDYIGIADVSSEESSQVFTIPIKWNTEDDGVSFSFSDPEDRSILNPQSTYRVFYPYDKSQIYTDVAVYDENEPYCWGEHDDDDEDDIHKIASYVECSFEGQKQMENNCTDHLSNYIFYYSDAFKWNDSEQPININMHPESSILKMELSLPKGEYQSITVENVYNDSVFDKSVCFSTCPWHYTISHPYNFYIKNVDYTKVSSQISLELYSKAFKSTKTTKYTFYLALGCKTTGNFVIKAKSKTGTYRTKILDPIAMKPGKYYTVTADCNEKGSATPKQKSTKNGHEWVDLGLPSHLKWATMNVGAKSDDLYGGYYAWGELKDKRFQNPNYDWTNYKWCSDNSNENSKYTDNDVLNSEDDAAFVSWGSGWRMPTDGDYFELSLASVHFYIDNYEYDGKPYSGVICYKPKGKDAKNPYPGMWTPMESYTPTNDLHIFFPLAGYYNENGRDGENNLGAYWTSVAQNSSNAYTYCFSSIKPVRTTSYMYHGLSIRPVCMDAGN